MAGPESSPGVNVLSSIICPSGHSVTFLFILVSHVIQHNEFNIGRNYSQCSYTNEAKLP